MLLVQLFARLVNNSGHCFGLLPSSRLVLSTCVRNVEPCFYAPPFLCRSGTEFVLNHDRLCHICCFVICAQIEKCNQVFPWCPQNQFKSCPVVRPSRKVLRLFASIHTSSVGVVLLVTSHRARLENSDKNKFVYLDLELEYPRTLRSANLGGLKSPRTLEKQCDLMSDTSGDLCRSCVCCL